MKDHVILFGAGASFGAGDILPERPPLGFQLFERLTLIFKGTWGNLPKSINRLFIEKGFEDGMQEIYNNYSHIISPLMRDLAVYLIQLRSNSNNSVYNYLINGLNSQGLLNKILFSTLNYDCIFEFCLLSQGETIAYWNYGNESEIPIWKIHGSCNWFLSDVKATDDVLFSKDVTFDGNINAFLDISSVIENCINNQGLYPAMCLFMKGKPIPVAPSIIRNLQGVWQENILNAKSVTCIGVNPLPEDSHIWNAIGDTKAKFLYIGDQKAFTDWTISFRKEPSIFVAPYFSTGIKKLIKEIIKL